MKRDESPGVEAGQVAPIRDALVISMNGPVTARIEQKLVKLAGMPISVFVDFFMVRPAFPSAIERRTAFRSMW